MNFNISFLDVQAKQGSSNSLKLFRAEGEISFLSLFEYIKKWYTEFLRVPRVLLSLSEELLGILGLKRLNPY